MTAHDELLAAAMAMNDLLGLSPAGACLHPAERWDGAVRRLRAAIAAVEAAPGGAVEWEPDPEALKLDGSWHEQRAFIEVPETRRLEVDVWTSNRGKTWCWQVYDPKTNAIVAHDFDATATEAEAKRRAEAAARGGR